MSDCRFFVRGEIDLASAPDLQRDLEETIATTTGDLVLDCCGITFLDSTGVGVFVHAKRLLAAQGRDIRIVNADQLTVRVLELLGLAEILHVDR
jgi:anti-sigma B factor antagonist